MLLADLGAEGIRVERTTEPPHNIAPERDFLLRGRKSICLDLKTDAGQEAALRLAAEADILLEGYRPGVMERLGLGPDVCLGRSPRLIYGRMTGWGQTGPLAHTAGHDINYIALAGVLAHMGRQGEKPNLPLNLVGDFGGGGLMLAFGVLAALLERQSSGRGQVVDSAIVDGAAILMGTFYAARNNGSFDLARGTDILSGASPFYDVYETADGKFISIGAGEPKFYTQLLKILNLENRRLPDQYDRSKWDDLKACFEDVFRSKTRDEWCALMEGTDVCFSPVLDIDEAPQHPHNRDRQTFICVGGDIQPAPAPRFSRTGLDLPLPGNRCEPQSDSALLNWGFGDSEIELLRDVGALR
jgi:alpha-methylacyl-CoA racemase